MNVTKKNTGDKMQCKSEEIIEIKKKIGYFFLGQMQA